MDNISYESVDLTDAQVDDACKYINEGTICNMMLFNGNLISVTPPNHMVLKIEY